MYHYYLIRRCGSLQFISAACLPSHTPCEVVGSCYFSSPLSLHDRTSLADLLNNRDI